MALDSVLGDLSFCVRGTLPQMTEQESTERRIRADSALSQRRQ